MHQETTAVAVVRSENLASVLIVGELTPNDTDHGHQRAILIRREKIKRLTLERREKENLGGAA